MRIKEFFDKMVPDLEGDAPGTLRPYSPKKLFQKFGWYICCESAWSGILIHCIPLGHHDNNVREPSGGTLDLLDIIRVMLWDQVLIQRIPTDITDTDPHQTVTCWLPGILPDFTFNLVNLSVTWSPVSREVFTPWLLNMEPIQISWETGACVRRPRAD